MYNLCITCGGSIDLEFCLVGEQRKTGKPVGDYHVCGKCHTDCRWSKGRLDMKLESVKGEKIDAD